MPALQHIVLLKLSDKCGSKDVDEFNEQFKRITEEIPSMICGSITSVEYEKKFNTMNQHNYTHIIVCLYSNIQGLEHYYNTSIEHEKLKGMIGQFIDGELKDNIVEMDSWNPAISCKL